MKLLLFLLLLIAANAKVAILDIVASSHLADDATIPLYPSQPNYNAGGAKGCTVLQFDGKIKKAGGGICPPGSACVDGAVPVCKTLTKVVHQGANGYDFETENVVNVPTQIDTLVEFDATNGDKVDAEATSGKTNKFLLYRVHLQNVNEDKYDGCHISVGGTMVAAASTDPPAVLTGGTFKAGDQSAVDHQFLSETGKVSCEFRMANNGYMGLVTLNVSFTKVESQMDIGEKSIDSVEAHLRYVPGSDDSEWHNPITNAPSVGTLFPNHARAATGANKYISTAHSDNDSVMTFDTGTGYSDGFLGKLVSGGASAIKGTVKLPIRAIFYDRRYKVVDQSGVESLSPAIGNGEMHKEGMDIHYDFANFYNAAQNSFTNDNIDMKPVGKFSDYATGNVVPSGSNVGVAQFELKHEYTYKYGGYDGNEMPHFQKEYLSCPLCDARVVFKAFEKDAAYSDGSYSATSPENRDYLLRYYVPITIAGLPIATNNIELDDIEVELVEPHDEGVYGHSKMSDGTIVALRLPTAIDPQYPDGHAVGEFFKVKKAATPKQYISLVSEYTILDTRLTTSGGKATMEKCGDGYGKGPLYQLGSDIVTKAQEIFDRDCRIKITADSFGFKSTLIYTPHVAANAKTATILQTDDRQIMAGNTELSILRRKTDTSATNSGPQVTFSVSKVTGDSNAIKFKVKGSNTMLGYGSDGGACTQDQVCAHKGLKNTAGVCLPCASPGNCNGGASAGEADTHTDHVASGKLCKAVLGTAGGGLQGEGDLETSGTDGVSKPVIIRSSSDCFLYMDVELQTLKSDNTELEFAAYALRLPCVRTTDQLEDALNLTYAFETSYSLSTDRVSGEIDYALPTGMDLSVVQSGFGSCGKNESNFDELFAPTDCKDVSGAAQPIGGWANDGNSKIVLDKDDKVDLATLKKCDTAAAGVPVSGDDKSYLMVHYLGLVYARDYFSGGRTMSRTYCQDQKFVTNIRRDATASVSVATLVSPTLTRSVMVSGLSWVQCGTSDQNCKGSSNCYKFRIDLDVTEKDDSAIWGNATLSSAFLPGSGGLNTDSMLIVEDFANTNNVHKNYLSLESNCGPVDSCDSDSEHYSDIADGTEQDIVIRGPSGGVYIDTAVNVQTKFEECPLEKATVDLGGELKVGMGLLCAKSDGNGGYDVYGTANNGGGGAKSTVDSDVSIDDPINAGTEISVQRCATALASSKVKASAQVFLDGLNSSSLTKANSRGWKFKDIDWSIERFERDLLGQKDESKKISSDKVMSMTLNSDGSTYGCAAGVNILFGLPNAFDTNILKCPTLTTEAAISEIEFDLAPLQAANMDVFEVRVDAILRNTNLDTRRLRGVIPLHLRADGSLEASSGSFEVLPASKDISDAIYESPDTPEEHSANHTEVIMIISIVVLAIIVLVLAIRCACSKDGARNKVKAMAGMDEETKPLTGSVTGSGGPSGKEAKFSNLRY